MGKYGVYVHAYWKYSAVLGGYDKRILTSKFMIHFLHHVRYSSQLINTSEQRSSTAWIINRKLKKEKIRINTIALGEKMSRLVSLVSFLCKFGATARERTRHAALCCWVSGWNCQMIWWIKPKYVLFFPLLSLGGGIHVDLLDS